MGKTKKEGTKEEIDVNDSMKNLDDVMKRLNNTLDEIDEMLDVGVIDVERDHLLEMKPALTNIRNYIREIVVKFVPHQYFDEIHSDLKDIGNDLKKVLDGDHNFMEAQPGPDKMHKDETRVIKDTRKTLARLNELLAILKHHKEWQRK